MSNANREPQVVYLDDGHHSRHGASMKPVRLVVYKVHHSAGHDVRQRWEIMDHDATGAERWTDASPGTIEAYKTTALAELAERAYREDK